MGWQSLTLFPSDRLWLSQLLVRHQALIFHSAGGIFDRKGFLFIGRSEAGKTTISRMLRDKNSEKNIQTEILCDESNIVRYDGNHLRLYGTWSHGEEESVSANHCALNEIFVLRKDENNFIETISNPKLALKALFENIYRPFMTKSWWKRALNIIEICYQNIPISILHFDKSGEIISMLKNRK